MGRKGIKMCEDWSYEKKLKYIRNSPVSRLSINNIEFIQRITPDLHCELKLNEEEQDCLDEIFFKLVPPRIV